LASGRGSASLAVLAPLSLSALLLASGGPLLHALTAAAGAALGFAPGRALVVRLDASASSQDRERQQRVRAQVLERVRVLRDSERAFRERAHALQGVEPRFEWRACGRGDGVDHARDNAAPRPRRFRPPVRG
jgi:hypothetical protein